jgi:hypothetical protein
MLLAARRSGYRFWRERLATVLYAGVDVQVTRLAGNLVAAQTALTTVALNWLSMLELGHSFWILAILQKRREEVVFMYIWENLLRRQTLGLGQFEIYADRTNEI